MHPSTPACSSARDPLDFTSRPGVPHVRELDGAAPAFAHQQDQSASGCGFLDGGEAQPSVPDLRKKLRSDLALNGLKVPPKFKCRNRSLPSVDFWKALRDDFERFGFDAFQRYSSKVQK